jgi:Rrf2 family protein
MKISTNCHYATIALMDIATHQEKGPVPLRNIAQRHFVSVRHLARAMVPLVNKRIVYSYRGIGGGFTLRKAVDEIKISDIYRLFEGSFAIVDDIRDLTIDHNPEFCSVNYIWEEIQDKISSALNNRTIGDLMRMRELNRKRTERTYSVWAGVDFDEQYDGVLLS